MAITDNPDLPVNDLIPDDSQRKSDHINLALKSQTLVNEADNRFYYEPMISGFPLKPLDSTTFAGKKMRVPIWVSSMTGGHLSSGKINRNLATACKEFGMGMGSEKKMMEKFSAVMKDLICSISPLVLSYLRPYLKDLGLAMNRK